MPLAPTNFNITEQYDGIRDATITLNWSPPQGGAIVEYYNITVTPSRPVSSMLYAPPVNVTLDYNVEYNISIASVNCAGESELSVLTGIEFGKQSTVNQKCGALTIYSQHEP